MASPSEGTPILSDPLRLVLNAALLAVLGYAAICAGMYVFQRRLIYHGGGPRPVAPAGVEERKLTTADGLELLAWYLKPVPGRPVVLLLHGNAGDLGNRVGRLPPVAQAGWGMLLVEYRGFGGNPGSPTEEGVHQDALAGYAALRAMGIPPERIVIWGESLGTAVAVRLASERPAAALVLESPFTSMTEMARRVYPFVPVEMLLKDPFDSLGRIGAVRMPVLVINGALDSLVPPEMGQRLLAAAGAEVRELHRIDEAGHNDMVEHGVMQIGMAFLRRHLPSS